MLMTIERLLQKRRLPPSNFHGESGFLKVRGGQSPFLQQPLRKRDSDMNPNKQAAPDHPIHELIARRWSPYGFAERAVPEEALHSLFEAARWAASSYNEQP